jgi:hypothetical protein
MEPFVTRSGSGEACAALLAANKSEIAIEGYLRLENIELNSFSD